MSMETIVARERPNYFLVLLGIIGNNLQKALCFVNYKVTVDLHSGLLFGRLRFKCGMLFRSTHKYTVCGLTPKNPAASRTVHGDSSWFFGRSGGLMFPCILLSVYVPNGPFVPTGPDQFDYPTARNRPRFRFFGFTQRPYLSCARQGSSIEFDV
jgi:hypothetical protein